MRISPIHALDSSQLLRFNVFKFLAVSGFGPFEIYSLLFLSSTVVLRLVFGLILIFGMIFSILTGPFVGNLIDSYPRKRILSILLYLWIFSCLGAFFLWKTIPDTQEFIIPILLVFTDVTGGIFYSATRALQQTITPMGNYGKSNAYSEISGQLPSLIGAGTAIPFLLFIGPLYSPLLAVLFTVAGIILLRGMDEKFTPTHIGVRNMRREERTLRFVKTHLSEVLFFYFLNFTFIAVMIGNFLKPVFIVEILHGNAESISLSEIVYAVMGSTTGVILSLFHRGKSISILYLFIGIFGLGSLLIPISPDFAFFLAFQTLHGIGNPGARISRNTIIMHGVPPEMVGRFYAGIQLLSNITRLVLLVAVTAAISYTGPGLLIELTGVMVIAAMLISTVLYFTRTVVRDVFNSSDNNRWFMTNAGHP